MKPETLGVSMAARIQGLSKAAGRRSPSACRAADSPPSRRFRGRIGPGQPRQVRMQARPIGCAGSAPLAARRRIGEGIAVASVLPVCVSRRWRRQTSEQVARSGSAPARSARSNLPATEAVAAGAANGFDSAEASVTNVGRTSAAAPRPALATCMRLGFGVGLIASGWRARAARRWPWRGHCRARIDQRDQRLLRPGRPVPQPVPRCAVMAPAARASLSECAFGTLPRRSISASAAA